jgi:PTS system mannose-specific IID component
MMTTNNTATPTWTKKELHKLDLGWIWNSQIGWNYERMQGLGYLTAMLPVIEKLYGDNPELKQKALETQSVFFNTTPQMGDIIFGMDIAIEETDRTEAGLQVAASIKTALMGPFAGIGDTIFGVISGAVFGSIAASMAIEGNAVGTFLWVAWYLFVLLFRFKLFDLGYTQGVKLVTTYQSRMNAVIEAAGVLGLTVVGGMIASMVSFPLATYTVNLGVDSTGADIINEYNLQTYADSIMPKLFPALLAWGCYVLLGKKWMNSNKLIWMVIILAIVLRLLGILSV